MGKIYGNRFPESGDKKTSTASSTGNYSYIVVDSEADRDLLPVKDRKLGATVVINGKVKKFMGNPTTEWTDVTKWRKLDIELEEDFKFTVDAHGAAKNDVITADGVNNIIDVLKKAWSPFVANQLTSMSVYSDDFGTQLGTYEVGTTVKFKSVSVSYTLNSKDEGLSTMEVYYQNNATTANYQAFANLPADGSSPWTYARPTSVGIHGNAVGDANILAVGKYSNEGFFLTNQLTKTVLFRLKRFYLASTLTTGMTDAIARSGEFQYDTNKAGSVSLNIQAGEYGWIIQPASWGSVQLYEGGFPMAVEAPETFNIILPDNTQVSYFAYRLSNPSTGEITINIV